MDWILGIVMWIFKSWFTRLAEIAVIAVVAYWAKYKNQSTAIAIAIGLVSLVAILELHDRVEIWALEKQKELHPAQSNIPPEEVVRKWLDKTGYSIAKIKPSEGRLFHYKGTFDAITVGIYQNKDDPSIFFVESDMEYSTVVDALTIEQRRIIGLKIHKELLMFGMDDVNVITSGVRVSATFPFDETMNWIDFIHYVGRVRKAVHLAGVIASTEAVLINQKATTK